jgi:hypothetical protein
MAVVLPTWTCYGAACVVTIDGQREGKLWMMSGRWSKVWRVFYGHPMVGHDREQEEEEGGLSGGLPRRETRERSRELEGTREGCMHRVQIGLARERGNKKRWRREHGYAMTWPGLLLAKKEWKKRKGPKSAL